MAVLPATARPTFPRWANAGGTVIEPASAIKNVGWEFAEFPPHEYANWLALQQYNLDLYIDERMWNRFTHNLILDGLTEAAVGATTWDWNAGAIRASDGTIVTIAAGQLTGLSANGIRYAYVDLADNTMKHTASAATAMANLPVRIFNISGGVIVLSEDISRRFDKWTNPMTATVGPASTGAQFTTLEAALIHLKTLWDTDAVNRLPVTLDIIGPVTGITGLVSEFLFTGLEVRGRVPVTTAQGGGGARLEWGFDGALFKPGAGVSNVRFRDFVVKQTVAPTTDPNGVPFLLQNAGTDNISVERVYSDDGTLSRGFVLSEDASNNVSIVECAGQTTDFVFLLTSSGTLRDKWRIEYNAFSRAGTSSGSSFDGIGMDTGSTADVEGLIVMGNSIEGYKGDGIVARGNGIAIDKNFVDGSSATATINGISVPDGGSIMIRGNTVPVLGSDASSISILCEAALAVVADNFVGAHSGSQIGIQVGNRCQVYGNSLDLTGSAGACIKVDTGISTSVFSNYVEDGGTGIELSGCSRCSVANNNLLNQGAGGILLSNGTSNRNITVTGNNIDLPIGIGIAVTASYDKVSIEGNTISFAGSHGIQVGSGTHISVCDNVIDNPTGSGVSLISALHSSVVGNTIFSPTLSGIILSSANYCAVGSNTIQDPTLDGIVASGALACSINGNTVLDAGGLGISILAGSDGTMVSGNTITDPTGIAIRFNANRGGVTVNSIYWTGATGASIDTNVAGSNRVVTGNNLGGGTIATSGTDTVANNEP